MIVYDGIVFSLQRAGGITVLFRELFARLPRASYEIVGIESAAPAAVAGFPYRYQVPRRLERYRRARIGPECTLFHSTYYRLPQRGRAKVVTTVLDYIYERLAPTSPRTLVHSLQKNAAVRGSDAVICISESTRRDLIEYTGAAMAGHAVVIPLAASPQFRPLPGTTVLPQVLFVGGRVLHKNFRQLVDAMQGLPDLELVCVGGGPFSDEEIAFLDRRLAGRYRAAGHLSIEDLNLEYNRSLCLAYPSRYEGFGIPVLEGMQAGCPVIAVNASSIPEVAGDAAILLERGEPDAIRAAIESLRAESNRRELIQRGFAQAARFSWDLNADRTRQLYAELTGKAGG
jgi:mannosyltransferase